MIKRHKDWALFLASPSGDIKDIPAKPSKFTPDCAVRCLASAFGRAFASDHMQFLMVVALLFYSFGQYFVFNFHILYIIHVFSATFRAAMMALAR